MNVVEQWASDYGVPQSALDDLLVRLGALLYTPTGDEVSGRESSLQAAVRVAEGRLGNRMFRNNNGVAIDSRNIPIRYGLGNDSKKVINKIKSSDLIGIERVRVTPEMVGSIHGLFKSLEIKRPGWKWRGNAEEKAQLRWLIFVNLMGGRAKFVSSLKEYQGE